MTRADDALGRHLPRYASAGRAVALGSAMLLVLFVWAALTDVEVVVSAPASARPVTGVAELRAPDTRGVARVLAREGQRVAQGDVIVMLESQPLDAQWHSVARGLERRRQMLADSRAVARLVNSGAPASEAPTLQSKLQIMKHSMRLAQLDDEVRALQSELQAAASRAAEARRVLTIERQRHRAAETAFEQGALSRFEILRARQTLLSRQAETQAKNGQVDVLRERLSGRRNARRRASAEHRHALMETIASLEVEVAEMESRLAEVTDRRRRGLIRAPVDGVLDQLRVDAGDFVQRGEPLGVVVPAAAAVRFETRIAPRQAAFLHVGQACRIKLDALPFARYGALPCTVELLGRDVVEIDNGPDHYLAHVRPTAQSLEADGQPVRLQPGATAWVDIIAGRRTVLSFVTEPLRRFARESLRER